ncbi:hypothetical protein B296_00004920 [Ensete ventricosum]|uniref:Uncharacterized protein n=1 Tax=Ensete ventricosum TaxID=4639 RepID=A0A427B5A1_ENSVE|nr:hypothetical protein B296_00004920 [Ensete ventricosum]
MRLPSSVLLTISVASGTGCNDVSCLKPLFSPPIVSRAGQMSLVSSHSESRSVKILARRSRVLDRSSGDSRSTAVLSSSRGVAPANSGAVEALVAMHFPTEWKSQTVNNSVPMLLANEIELVKILRGIFYASRGVKDMNEAWLAEAGLNQPPEFDGGANSGSTVPSTTSAFGPIDVAGSMVEKRPSTSEGASLRKRSRKAAPKRPADASGSATRAPAEKGKEPVEVEEALE